ncbi:fimbrial biogenesis usher protein [Enterobacter sp. A103]|uniref:fimbrial biogenesis usher protein n=1 Tax=Enterobacter sp. A103 TaxID=3102785 RepID=UPI002ACA890C|nr:fimbrial biogenesis usher protein [Enterobacter sp. A103]MDZ5641678.1 fimbrial biogenesis usher protein [Enterobacter sp. A103]
MTLLVKIKYHLNQSGRVILLLTLLLLSYSRVTSARLYFDPSMLSGDPNQVTDLSRFEDGQNQLPGVYLVDVYLNGHSVFSRQLRFETIPAPSSLPAGKAKSNDGEVRDSTGLAACLTKKELAELGVNFSAVADLQSVPDGQCVSLGKYIPGAYIAFNFQAMRLDVSIPQIALRSNPRGWIPPEQWDEGINAALLSWQFSGSNSQTGSNDSSSQYLNLSSGVNFGAWRLRDNSVWSHYTSRFGHNQRWQHLDTYIQRTVIPLNSEFTGGDSTTGSDVFDSLTFRGLQLATDDTMYPDSMRGFAPEIKGVANSNAQVSITQNGNEVYRTFVAPGAFVINDLYPLSSGGDLEVTVKEADGALRVFTVPYSSLPVLQRQGRIRYSLTAGRYRSNNDRYTHPAFVQGTLQWGLPFSITAYGGTQLADNYQAIAIGTGFNMGGWGALSWDVTQADSLLADGSRHQGQSLRVLYGRSLISTGTTFRLAGYRYSTQGFHTLDETALKKMSGWLVNPDISDAAGHPVKADWNDYYNLYSSKRERLQINISQRLGDLGSLYVTGNHQSYWHKSTVTDSFQIGFSGMLSRITYNLSYDYSRMSDRAQRNRTFWLSLSVPLEAHVSEHPVWATYSARSDTDGGVTHQAGLSGMALAENNLDWSVSQGYGRQEKESGDAGMSYQGTYGNASFGYGYGKDYHQWRYGVSGGAVLHSEGLTLGQPLGTTSVLVVAPGAVDVPVENSTGVHTDWRGYSIVPYANAYRENDVMLDTSKLDDHTDISNAAVQVVPTHGAVVKAHFDTYTGARGLITLQHNGRPVPFGATATLAAGNSDLVGDNGQVYLSGMAQDVSLTAKWGNKPDQQCVMHHRLTENELHARLVRFQENCR